VIFPNHGYTAALLCVNGPVTQMELWFYALDKYCHDRKGHWKRANQTMAGC
jgi:hypothetical protein